MNPTTNQLVRKGGGMPIAGANVKKRNKYGASALKLALDSGQAKSGLDVGVASCEVCPKLRDLHPLPAWPS